MHFGQKKISADENKHQRNLKMKYFQESTMFPMSSLTSLIQLTFYLYLTTEKKNLSSFHQKMFYISKTIFSLILKFLLRQNSL